LSTKSGVAAIADEVVGDIQKEAEATISVAENQAKETLRVAKEQADRTYQAALAEAKEKAESEKRKIGSVAEVEVRNRLLQVKEELVDEAFEKALVKLKNYVATEEYHSYLLKLIEYIAKKMDQKVLVVEVNAKDKGWLTQDMLKSVSKKLHVEFRISDQTMDYIGGCRIQSEDGKVVYDGTLDNRLAELKPELRAQVAKTLFGEET
jgi:V/A-type H+-transporting ATPase subunit E